MLSILRKTAASMAQSGGTSFHEQYDGVFNDDLTAWELVNASSSDDEDLYSFDGDDDVECCDHDDEPDDDVIHEEPEATQVEEDDEEDDSRGLGSPDDVISDEQEAKPVEEDDSCDLGSPDDIISMEATVSPAPAPAMTFRCIRMCHDRVYGGGDGHGCDDTDDDHVYDDELLAWNLEERFGKQRLKKSKTTGKRSRPDKSKRRLPYYYNRPGCMYGGNMAWVFKTPT